MRFLRAAPKNPLVMSPAEREQVGHAFGQLAGRLPAGQSLQFYVEATPGPARRAARPQRGRRRARDPGAGLATATGPARCGGCTPRCASRWSATPTSRPPSTSPTTSSSPTCPTRATGWTGGAAARRPPAAGERAAGALAGVASARGARVAAPDRLDPRRPRGARSLHPPARPAPRSSTCCGGASTRPPPTARPTADRAPARSGSRSSASSTPSPTRATPPGPRTRCASWSPRRGSTGPTSATCASTATSSRRSTSPRCRTRPSSGGCWTRCRSRGRSRSRCTCTRWTGCASARASRRATAGCSASTAAPSCAAARRTTRCSPRRRSSASCSRSSPGTSARRAFEVSIYQSIRERGPDPDPVAARRGRRAGLPRDHRRLRRAREPRPAAPARALAVHAAARPRRRPAHAQVRHPPRRRHRPAGRHRAAGRRPGSRSRSPTPAARSR